ncbi:hypothetical protein WICPIJ_000586 [Wickerhamomyces pijperi]|uniref:Uncharacterized protein n=1 Tax=Wickerhamomyces pijperi TaxID=599730 RepID=A0A9P8QD98_WICPI|nr:hypothetical protein WICPIJ_000586 [Wickerhamomyces pijperi]
MFIDKFLSVGSTTIPKDISLSRDDNMSCDGFVDTQNVKRNNRDGVIWDHSIINIDNSDAGQMNQPVTLILIVVQPSMKPATAMMADVHGLGLA